MVREIEPRRIEEAEELARTSTVAFTLIENLLNKEKPNYKARPAMAVLARVPQMVGIGPLRYEGGPVKPLLNAPCTSRRHLKVIRNR